MRATHDLSQLEWKLAGFTPYSWGYDKSMEVSAAPNAEVPAVSARVPGSVQAALREAGVIPDWNVGLDSRACEWVEHRHWIFEARLPAEWLGRGGRARLRCLGLDGPGWVNLDGRDVGAFANAFVPHVFDLGEAVDESGGLLRLVFDCPPRWLGQFGHTSRMHDMKPRFNYTWDWTPRLVQIGPWDEALLEVTDGTEIASLGAATAYDLASGTGAITLLGEAIGPAGAVVRVEVSREGRVVAGAEFPPDELARGARLEGLAVEPWWPNGLGAQPLYEVSAALVSADGREFDRRSLRTGFRDVRWEACEGAPEAADPWVCVVNGTPVFLQGVNWTPIRPNFADVREGDYARYVERYRELGVNCLRVWGGAVLERECFYNLCDEAGILVWQEFPLSSSGIENWPPEDAGTIDELERVARSYVERRRHHPSLLMWCGGNELQGSPDGRKTGTGKPVDESHPLIARLAEVCRELDPDRRFVATSASGPTFIANERDFGRGLHWDVHGPWDCAPPEGGASSYWQNDDALFRSELGSPGASPGEIIRRYSGGMPVTPGTVANPLWRRSTWWIQWRLFTDEKGREPGSLEEYVAWSQLRQRRGLELAVGSTKARFPRVGGVILWMGHDSFPVPANTSIIDFDGDPKPAAEAVGRIFRSET